MTAVPGLSITGSGSVNLTESQTEMMEHTTISVKMDGGGSCDATTYQQACDCFRELPEQGGTAENNYTGTAILDFHLSPLTDICVDADFVLNDINDEMIEQITVMLDELEQTGTKVKGLANRAPCQGEGCTTWADRFPPINDNLEEFRKEWSKTQLHIKGRLQHIIPKIREGTGGGEDELSSLLQEYADSVFAFEKSNEFLSRRNREISAVFHLSESFPEDVEDVDNHNIFMYDYKTANDVGTFIRKKFVILLELKILSPLKLTEDFLEGNEQIEDGFWFNNLTINGQIGSLVRNLSKFAWENDASQDCGYLVNLLEITDGSPDINVLAMNHGAQESNSSNPFEIPTAPEQPSIYHVGHKSIKLTVTRASLWTTGVWVHITDAFDVTNVLSKLFSFGDLPPRGEMEIEFNCTEALDCLEAITLYTATVQYDTNYGRSPPSKTSLRFLTAPSSPPTSLAVAAVSTNNLTVSWNEPAEMGWVNETFVAQRDLSYSVVLNGNACLNCGILIYSQVSTVTQRQSFLKNQHLKLLLGVSRMPQSTSLKRELSSKRRLTSTMPLPLPQPPPQPPLLPPLLPPPPPQQPLLAMQLQQLLLVSKPLQFHLLVVSETHFQVSDHFSFQVS